MSSYSCGGKNTLHSKPNWVSTSFLSFASQSIPPESEWSRLYPFAGFVYLGVNVFYINDIVDCLRNSKASTLTISHDCGNFVRLCFCVVSYYSFFVFIVTLVRETENCQSPRFAILEIASKWFQYCVAFIVSSKERVWAGGCVRVCEL